MRLLALLAATPPPPQSSQPYTVDRALADLDGASWSLVLEDGAGVRVWRDAASTSGAVVLKAEVECPVPPAVLVDILLTRDYEVYDAERKRLLSRARVAGLLWAGTEFGGGGGGFLVR